MKAKHLDRKFDTGQDITRHLDTSRQRRPNQQKKRLSLTLPLWMVHILDKQANRLAISRQALIKICIAERLERTTPTGAPTPPTERNPG
ncbi:MAG: hypothetical protein JW741_27130 [Sedimentisphaerales bacterium]|nr:hypothetical protein [Sedimentisphaerales bacterium]